jgi:hypothetical protein
MIYEAKDGEGVEYWIDKEIINGQWQWVCHAIVTPSGRLSRKAGFKTARDAKAYLEYWAFEELDWIAKRR